MAALVGDSNMAGIYRRRDIPLVITQGNPSKISSYFLVLYPSCRGQRFSSSADSVGSEFSKQNAYELLGVSETSSFAEIKASFHKLAKQTHPDVAQSKRDSDASQRFVQILAAYEVLSWLFFFLVHIYLLNLSNTRTSMELYYIGDGDSKFIKLKGLV